MPDLNDKIPISIIMKRYVYTNAFNISVTLMFNVGSYRVCFSLLFGYIWRCGTELIDVNQRIVLTI